MFQIHFVQARQPGGGGTAGGILPQRVFAALQLIPALLAGYGLSVPYNLLAAVGVWRSADKYQGEKQWADLARLTTIAGMILLSIT